MGGVALMPRIRWARRLADGTEQNGIECVCGGDLLAADEPGLWRCQRCRSELRLAPAPPTDALTGETAAASDQESAWSVWADEQRYKRAVSKPGGRSSSRGRFRRRKPLTKKRRRDEA